MFNHVDAFLITAGAVSLLNHDYFLVPFDISIYPWKAVTDTGTKNAIKNVTIFHCKDFFDHQTDDASLILDNRDLWQNTTTFSFHDPRRRTSAVLTPNVSFFFLYRRRGADNHF